MVNLKFLIDITRSNKNNLPAIYRYLDQLLTWLEAGPATRDYAKQYVVGYISGEGLHGSLKTFTEKAAFFENFMQQKIQKGNPDGKEDVIKAIETMLNHEVADENALFVFTDQSMEKAYRFSPPEGKGHRLTAVYLFVDCNKNVSVEGINRLDFDIDRSRSGSSNAAESIDLEAIKRADAMNGGPADIRMMVGKLFTQDSREVQGAL